MTVTAPGLARVWSPHIERDLWLRQGTADERTWGDTFTAGYATPPGAMTTPRTVLDLGAHVGLTAALYRYLWPQARIVAVELDADNAGVGRANAPTAEWRCHAVDTEPGRVSYDTIVPSDSFRATRRVGRLPAGWLVADALTLRETILDAFGDDGVDFVKMDVEGAEHGLLANPDWAPLVRYLLVELHPAGHARVVDRRLLAPEDEEPDDDLVAVARLQLEEAGFLAHWHRPHPHAVWAVRA